MNIKEYFSQFITYFYNPKPISNNTPEIKNVNKNVNENKVENVDENQNKVYSVNDEWFQKIERCKDLIFPDDNDIINN